MQNSNSNDIQIAAVHYDGDEITEFRLKDGRTMSYLDAISLAESHQLPGYTVGKSRGVYRDVLRGVNDGDPSNNLSNLPRY